jgi:hypothetical protein
VRGSNGADRWSGGQGSGSTPTISDNEQEFCETVAGLGGLDAVPELESPPDPPDIDKMVASHENLNDLDAARQHQDRKLLHLGDKFLFSYPQSGKLIGYLVNTIFAGIEIIILLCIPS